MNKQSDLTVKQAFEDLEKITQDLESDDLEIEEMIPKYKRGLELVHFIKKRLLEIKIEVKKIKEEYSDLEVSKEEALDKD